MLAHHFKVVATPGLLVLWALMASFGSNSVATPGLPVGLIVAIAAVHVPVVGTSSRTSSRSCLQLWLIVGSRIVRAIVGFERNASRCDPFPVVVCYLVVGYPIS